MKGKILKLVTILSLFMLMLSCGSDKKEEAKQEGAATEAKADNKEVKKYVIGSDVAFAPFEFMKDGKYEGVDSPIFALAFVMAFVVMYDACGVRRAAGKQAKLLNKIIETPGLSGVQVSERLVEVLGHTPTQVVVGAIIGIIVGLII